MNLVAPGFMGSVQLDLWFSSVTFFHVWFCKIEIEVIPVILTSLVWSRYSNLLTVLENALWSLPDCQDGLSPGAACLLLHSNWLLKSRFCGTVASLNLWLLWRLRLGSLLLSRSVIQYGKHISLGVISRSSSLVVFSVGQITFLAAGSAFVSQRYQGSGFCTFCFQRPLASLFRSLYKKFPFGLPLSFPQVATWDVIVVLSVLQKLLFEPIRHIPLSILTHKVVFLVAFTSEVSVSTGGIILQQAHLSFIEIRWY